jgi:hypothetical protein
LDPNVTPFHFSELEGEKIEKKRAVAVGVDRNQVSSHASGKILMDIFQVRGFTASGRTVIYDFAIDGLPFQINDRHSSKLSVCAVAPLPS